MAKAKKVARDSLLKSINGHWICGRPLARLRNVIDFTLYLILRWVNRELMLLRLIFFPRRGGYSEGCIVIWHTEITRIEALARPYSL